MDPTCSSRSSTGPAEVSPRTDGILVGMTPLPPPLPHPVLRVPDWPLPAYRFVPGLNPHPFRHPDGHMYVSGDAPPEAPWNSETPWMTDRRYLRGMDLFDQRFYWESHEAWEALWHHAERGTAVSDLLQALIQAGAFMLKTHLGQERGARDLLTRSTGRLRSVAEREGPVWRGLDLLETTRRLDAYAAGGPWPLLANLDSHQRSEGHP